MCYLYAWECAGEFVGGGEVGNCNTWCGRFVCVCVCVCVRARARALEFVRLHYSRALVCLSVAVLSLCRHEPPALRVHTEFVEDIVTPA
jgi:hypothetical protein